MLSNSYPIVAGPGFTSLESSHHYHLYKPAIVFIIVVNLVFSNQSSRIVMSLWALLWPQYNYLVIDCINPFGLLSIYILLISTHLINNQLSYQLARIWLKYASIANYAMTLIKAASVDTYHFQVFTRVFTPKVVVKAVICQCRSVGILPDN